MKDKPFSLDVNKGGNLNRIVIVEPLLRINPDIRKWRYALRSAEDADYPDRSTLYDIYEETMLDGMVTSVTERIFLKCSNSKIIFQKEGQADKEHPISKLTATPKFLQVIRWLCESKWNGHSLIEFEFEDDTIKDVHLIPRKNVIPEKGIVVKRVGEQEGISYREQPYIDYLLDVGGKRDLGLLNKATPHAIFKRFGISSWGEYVERYGIPIQEYKYDPQVPNSRNEVEKQAKEQGAGARIIMPMGTETTIHKSADGTGSAVFKEYKAANDEEILLIFLLQTMTTKDGSSRSQAEVHQGGENELIAGYKLFIEMVLNFQLKPLLEKHGFDVEGGEFKYEDTEKLSKKEILEILKGLAEFGDIPLEVIEEHFGIKLTPKEKEDLRGNEKEDDEKDDEKEKDEEEEKEGEKNKFDPSKKKSRYNLDCSCLHGVDNDLLQLNFTQEEENNLLQRIFESKGKAGFDSEYFNQLANGLIGELNGGWNESQGIDYDSPDHLTKSLLELNLYRFSATKDLSLINELNKFIPGAKSFSDFEKQAAPLLDQYNKNYLQTEFNLAISTAQNTSNYLRNLEVAEDFPYWEYQTIGDDRVRPAHAALDGILMLAGDSGALTTPNGFGCRCEWIPRDNKAGKQIYTEEQAIELLGDEFDKMQKSGFAVNRATQGLVFSEDQMYVPKFSEESLSYKDFGLPSYKEVANNASNAEKVIRNEQQAKEWFTSLTGSNDLEDDNRVRFLDYNQRPTHLDLSTLLSNKNWNVLDLIPGALSNPNEVYFNRSKGGYTLKMVKYYNPKPLVVELFVTPKDTKITKWSFAKNVSNARTGLLIKKA